MSSTRRSCLKPAPPHPRPSSAASTGSSASIASAASSWGTVATEPSSTPKPKANQPGQIQILPLISHNPHNHASPSLQWDIRQDFASTSRRITAKGLVVEVTNTDLDEPVTYPSAWTARIIIAPLGSSSSRSVGALLGPSVPPLTVTKPKDGQAITARDILAAVHGFLHVSVTQAQYNLACERLSQGQRTREGKSPGEVAIAKAFDKRCSEIAPIREVERAKGVRRVDLLGEAVKWAGAWPDYRYDEETKECGWELRVAVVPKPRP